jgi:hypothetical protein
LGAFSANMTATLLVVSDTNSRLFMQLLDRCAYLFLQ